MNERRNGVVKWFSDEKGYGFITPDGGGKDVFVHFSALPGKGRRKLEKGDAVSFAVEPGTKGPAAARVLIAGAEKPRASTEEPEEPEDAVDVVEP